MEVIIKVLDDGALVTIKEGEAVIYEGAANSRSTLYKLIVPYLFKENSEKFVKPARGESFQNKRKL